MIILLLAENNGSQLKALGRLLCKLGIRYFLAGEKTRTAKKIMIFIPYLSNITFMTSCFVSSNTFKPPSVNWQFVVILLINKWKLKKHFKKPKRLFYNYIVGNGYLIIDYCVPMLNKSDQAKYLFTFS